MGKGLTLSLNDLIKLGVIKTKKRKGRKGHKIKYKIENSTASSTLRQPSDHMRGYATVNNMPPIMNPYTDNLRLRDANDNFNTRLLEYKTQLHDEKIKTDDFIDQSKNAYRYLLQNIPTIDRFGTDLPVERRLGYDVGDSIDVPDTSTGFESQISQTQGGTSPYLIPGTPEYLSLQKPSEVIIEDDAGIDPSTPIQLRRRQTTLPSTPEVSKPKPKGFLGGIFSGEKGKGVQFEETTKVGGGGGGGGKATSASSQLSPPLHTVVSTKSKPTKEELQNWRKWYQDLGGEDDTVTASPHRAKYQQEISKLLLVQYVNAGGTDKMILKSKDPNLINAAIKIMLKEKFK